MGKKKLKTDINGNVCVCLEKLESHKGPEVCAPPDLAIDKKNVSVFACDSLARANSLFIIPTATVFICGNNYQGSARARHSKHRRARPSFRMAGTQTMRVHPSGRGNTGSN